MGAAAVAGLDAGALASALRDGGTTTLTVEGVGEVTLGPDDVVITETPREGWSVASDSGASVALDLTLTDELVRAGTAREVIRLVQEGRKSADYDVSDRIDLWWSSDDPELVIALVEHEATIAQEVLATTVTHGNPAADDEPRDLVRLAEGELPVRLASRRRAADSA